MKTIFFGEAASDSGSFGFSEAWPLCAEIGQFSSKQSPADGDFDGNLDVPSCPNRVDVHPLSNIHDQLHIGVVVVIGAAGHLNVVICHSDVVCVGLQIFGGGHDRELDGALVAECLVSPFSNRSDFLDGSDTVVGNQNLFVARKSASHVLRDVAQAHLYSPRFVLSSSSSPWPGKILTFVITVCPLFAMTKSFTFESFAFSTLLPPMKWSAIWCSSAYVCFPLFWGTTTPFRGALLVVSAIFEGGKDPSLKMCNDGVSRSLMIQRASGLRIRTVEPRAEEVEVGGLGRRCLSRKPPKLAKARRLSRRR